MFSARTGYRTPGPSGDTVHDVITWFDLHTTVAPPVPTANWSRVRADRIVAIRVAFDPRGLLDRLSRADQSAQDPADRTRS